MCGIIGAVSSRNVSSLLVNGLKQMEYRGYDSAGVSICNDEDELEVYKVKGRVSNLEEHIKNYPIKGHLGIAHTRWATHGVPDERNAHPIVSNNEFAVVHNGIIENHDELKVFLLENNYNFISDTDTEVIVHLIHYFYKNYINNNYIDKQNIDTKNIIKNCIYKTIEKIHGSYAIAVLSKHAPNCLYAFRSGSPLIIGLGIEENFIASDQLALISVSDKFIYLEEGDLVCISEQEVNIFDKYQKLVEREAVDNKATVNVISLGEYRHYMQKEIAEQPSVIADTISGNFLDNKILDTAFGINSSKIFDQTKAIHLVACGSSYHAALVAKYWLEKWARIPCSVSIASEYRMQRPIVQEGTLLVVISQSGETADLLSAVKLAKDLPEKNRYLASLAICNVPYSSLVREVDMVVYTRAGAEIGVASTKAFLTQLIALLMLTVCLARRNNTEDNFIKFNESELVKNLQILPDIITACLKLEKNIEDLSHSFVEKNHALFLGRGHLYPVAMEGALKLKEISYIHAESYPAGELKHGPLALVDEHMPVVALLANDQYQDKMLANLQEVKSRGGEVFIFAEENSKADYSKVSSHVCYLPETIEFLKPIMFTIPMQLLAYHIAVLRGTDVDKPRNLAKSVTVE